jgi:hypothetical protein
VPVVKVAEPPEVVPPLIEQKVPVLVAPVETVVDAPAA